MTLILIEINITDKMQTVNRYKNMDYILLQTLVTERQNEFGDSTIWHYMSMVKESTKVSRQLCRGQWTKSSRNGATVCNAKVPLACTWAKLLIKILIQSSASG